MASRAASRSEAVTLGLARYFNGVPCKYGHVAERTLSWNCVICQAQHCARWRVKNPEARGRHYQKNKEHESETNRRYISANKERLRKISEEWRRINRKTIAEKNAEWRRENPGYLAAHRRENRAKYLVYFNNRRERLSTGKLSAGIVENLLISQAGRCACCGVELGHNYHLDHKIPLCRGGRNVDGNVQLLTATCNLRKGRKLQ